MKQQNPKTAMMLSSMVLMVLFLTASPCSAQWYTNYWGWMLPVQAAPAPPTDVTASDGAYWGHIGVSWTHGTGGAQAFEVWRGTTSDSREAELLDIVTRLSYNDYKDVTSGKIYYYWVKSIGFGRQSSAPRSGFSAYDTGYRGRIQTAILPVGAWWEGAKTWCGCL